VSNSNAPAACGSASAVATAMLNALARRTFVRRSMMLFLWFIAAPV
jgi:hypothetical protein